MARKITWMGRNITRTAKATNPKKEITWAKATIIVFFMLMVGYVFSGFQLLLVAIFMNTQQIYFFNLMAATFLLYGVVFIALIKMTKKNKGGN